MSRFASPLWRVLGSIVSWLLFSLCFSLLYMGSATVMGLGGFCAQRRAVRHRDRVPGCRGRLRARSRSSAGWRPSRIGAIFAQGFGTPLISWAWPILFIGLGAAFLISSTTPGGITLPDHRRRCS